MSSKLERTTFSTPKGSGYLSVSELERLTGQPRYRFAKVVLKELLDNALDAAEEANGKPEVVVDIHWLSEDDALISVADSGDGMSRNIIERIFDFSMDTSDKRHFRTPTRGQQGNALKTILGIPFALDSTFPLYVQSRGITYEITPHLTPANDVNIQIEQDATEHDVTQVDVLLKGLMEQDFKPRRLVQEFAIFNPHALVTFREFFEDDDENEQLSRIRQKWSIVINGLRAGPSSALPEHLAHTGTMNPRSQR